MDEIETGRDSGDWSAREAVAKAFAGTIGIMSALAVDYIQKGGESALLYGTQMVNEYALSRFSVDAVPPFVYIILLIIAGFAMVYIFEPSNKRNAFYAGAGVLGFLATFSPVEQTSIGLSPGTLIEEPAPLQPDEASLTYEGLVTPAAWSLFPQKKGFQNAKAAAMPVRAMIQFPKDQPADSLPAIYAALHDFNSRRTYKLGTGGRLIDGRDGPLVVYDLVIRPGAPVGSTLAKLGMRIESQGYKVGYSEVTVTKTTPSPAVIQVTMEESNLPLAIERLRFPRKF